MLHNQGHFTRELLYVRHSLSHSQIDSWLGKSEQGSNVEEKLQEMTRIAEFIAVTDAFTQAGLQFISFKGPLLSVRLYRDATSRRYRDFDFLLTIADIEKAFKILMDCGYQPEDYVIPEDNHSKNKFFSHLREISLYNSEKDNCIELHWKLFSGRIIPQDQLMQIIRSNLSEISFAGRTFTVLNPELDLLYLVIHGGLHSFFRLKWLVDIKDFLEKVTIDKEKFLLLTNQLNASRMVALCNEVIKLYFPESNLLPGNYSAKSYLLRFTVEKIESKSEENVKSFRDFVRYYRFSFGAFPGWRYKISVFYYMFFLPYLVHSKKTPSNFFVLFFIVPFQAVSRWMKKTKNKT
jgi:hypothetical protein